MLTDYQEDALHKIIDAATKAGEQLKPAMGQRHFVVTLGGSSMDQTDLYWLLLRAETALLNLKEVAQKELNKRSK